MKIDEWESMIYEEAWRQYDHEDNLMEARNARYLTLQTILFGVLGFIISLSIQFVVDKKLIGNELWIFLLVISVISLFFSLISLRFIKFWKLLNVAGEKWLKLRFNVIKAIEVKNEREINIAIEEENWKKEHFNKKTDLEGFLTTSLTIKNLNIFWWSILIINVILILISAAFIIW